MLRSHFLGGEGGVGGVRFFWVMAARKKVVCVGGKANYFRVNCRNPSAYKTL